MSFYVESDSWPKGQWPNKNIVPEPQKRNTQKMNGIRIACVHPIIWSYVSLRILQTNLNNATEEANCIYNRPTHFERNTYVDIYSKLLRTGNVFLGNLGRPAIQFQSPQWNFILHSFSGEIHLAFSIHRLNVKCILVELTNRIVRFESM